MIITLELNETELEGLSRVSTSQFTDQSIKIKECIGSKETKHQSSLTHHLKEAYEEQPVSDAESPDKKEKEEQDIQRLDDDDSEAKSRKQDKSFSNQGLKDLRSSDLFCMLVSRRIHK